MNNWKKVKLGDISEMCLGKMLDKEKNKGEFEPYLANINVRWGGFDLKNLSMMRFEKSEHERYGLKFGDIVVCEGGEPGRCAIWKEAVPNMKIQKALHRVRITKDYSNQFVYYRLLLAGRSRELEKHFIGSTIKHLTGIALKKVEFAFPSFNEQQKIAAVLSALDSKIELNNRINAELEAIAKTLYDYWFVQFDFPDQNGKPYKTSGGKIVFNEELKREIPDGWTVGTLLDIADYTNGLPCQKFRPTGNDFLRVIKIREMGEGFSAASELVRADIPQKAIIENGDVLFSWSASLEVKIWTGGKGALNQHIFKVTSKKYPKSFFYYQLVNYLRHFKMIAENRKTTMGHITQEHLQQSRVILPKLEIVLKLDEIIAPLINKKILNELENQQLAELRDWLLPMLMNGQVRVAEIAKKPEVQPAVAASISATNGKSKQIEKFRQIQIFYATIDANKRIGVKQGEMATAKDVYILDAAFAVPTNFTFAQHNWGAFDPQAKAILNNKQYFQKVNFPNSGAYYLDLKDDGKLLEKIPAALVEQISNAVKEMHDKVFHKYFGSAKARMKELYATVLKCIEDKQSLSLADIRAAMTAWQIKQDGAALTKAEKFTEAETQTALVTIIEENWHHNVFNKK